MDKILRRRIQVSFYLQTFFNVYYVQNVVIYLLVGKTATNINFAKTKAKLELLLN